MSRQGGSWLFLYLDWEKYSTSMWVSLGINIFIRWVFQLLPIFLMVLTCEMPDPGGGVKYDMVNTLLKRTRRFSCAHCDFVMNIR